MPDSTASIPRPLPPGGSYRLRIRLARAVAVRVGSLGRLNLPAGEYLYCGSARRNLPARVARHLRRRKKKRWHIDHLLACRAARVVAVEVYPEAGECELLRRALRAGGRAIVPGFGSSDCRRGCPAHLLYLGPAGAGG